ncbi:thioredoxin family protein [Methylobacterium sp. WL19]|uniref:thioredoxin family protein n=1 Tax=Methylobacterium sp. WL19 TaxID=2603896 RepID=UPI0011CC8F3B|nr:thioredoxin family protein [Methylobacterium sp. WL19]TXN26746.1 thioredoxin family protein [Methylobacterium sp. WL19]
MISRRALLLTTALLAAAPYGASAAEPFDEAAFAAAQGAGRPVIVEVTAPWCPICKAQRPLLKALSEQPRFKDLAIYEIDFDTQKALMRRFDARMQSTLIVFKGREEVGRSVGETQGEWIEALVEKAL